MRNKCNISLFKMFNDETINILFLARIIVEYQLYVTINETYNVNWYFLTSFNKITFMSV